MAKQPKKPSPPAKAAAKSPKKTATKTKTVAKSKPANKAAATAAKSKPVAKATAATTTKPVAKATTAAKSKPAPKTQSKATVKRGSKKATAAPIEAPAVHSGVHPDGGGVPAAPSITAPLAGGKITAGADLTVDVNTNRPDLGYIIQLTDVTPPPAPPPVPAVPFQLPVPAPTGNPFSGTIPGANIAAGRVYQIRVFVNPADGGTPPNQDATITVDS